MITDKR